MQSGINRVMLFGNLGADPELRVTQQGGAILKLRLATNEVYADREKNLVERTEWHAVTVFGPRAEPLSKILTKGDAVFVEGTLRYSSYEKDGVTRYRTEVVVRDLCIASRRRASMPQPSATIEMLEDPFANETSTAEAPPAASPDGTPAEPAPTPGKKARQKENGAAHVSA